jgi:hypothetical protein
VLKTEERFTGWVEVVTYARNPYCNTFVDEYDVKNRQSTVNFCALVTYAGSVSEGRVLGRGQIDVPQNKKDGQDPNERIDFANLPRSSLHNGEGN